MIKKFYSIIGKETGGLHGAAVLLGIATLLSQLLGLARDHLLAAHFGAGETLDLYYAAFRIPDFLFIAVGSLLAVTVLVPLLVEIGDDRARLQSFLSSMLTIFTTLLLLASVVAYFAMPILARLIAPGFSQEQLATLTHLSRILLLSPFFLGLSNLFGSVTQARRQFLLYSISPILYNLGIISGVIVFYPIFGIVGLVYGVVLGALLHFLVQLTSSSGIFSPCQGGDKRGGMGFTRLIDWPVVRLVMSRSFPRAVAMGANQLSILVLIAYASHLASGSIAIFNLSYNLQSVPMALIGVSYSVAAFPTMVRHLVSKDKSQFLAYLQGVMRHVIFFAIPVATLFIVLREQVVGTVLGSGKFSSSSVHIAALSLAVFAISIVFQNITLLFDRSYYAAGKTFVPVITNIIGTVTAITLGYVFLTHPPITLTSTDSLVLFLPLAFACGVLANMLVEWALFRKDFGPLLSAEMRRTVGESIVAAAAMGLVAHLTLIALSNNGTISTAPSQAFAQGAVSGIVGIVVATAVLAIAGSKELKSIKNSLQSKFTTK